ncbi:MAG: hypothetical protein OEU60_12325, partial [Gammaproteobacteria bacterium]|nr:hypothetical protein [Gammaproteobacteria bacterium]
MKLRKPARRLSILMVVATALAACAAVPQITRLQAQSAPASTPYKNILVVSLFDSFDSRRYFEKETVTALEALGTKAVALTSQVDL